MIYSAGTVDQWPKNVSSHLMYGGMWKIPVPDIQRTDLLVVMGANPQASQGSLLAVPRRDGRDRRRSRSAAARSIVIDPRRTGTAEQGRRVAADHARHRRRAAARGRATSCSPRAWSTSARPATSSTASTSSSALVADWTPERVDGGHRHRRPSASARSPTSCADTERAVVYGRIGLCNQEFGTLASWLVDVVNILTGHFDVRGRADVPAARGLAGHRPADARPRGRRAQLRPLEDAGCAARPRCSATCRCRAWPRRSPRPGEGQIRALFTVAGNPVLSTPGGDRLDAALDGLDCMISVDNWINETTRHADVILPGLSPLEQAAPRRPDLAVRGRQRRPSTRAPIFPPDRRPARGVGDPHPARRRLPRAAGGRGRRGRHRRRVLRRAGRGARLRRRRRSGSGYDHGGPERLLDLTLRTGPFGDRYGEVPDGLDLEKVKAAAARHRPRADGAAPGRRARDRRRQGPRSRRRTSPPTCPGWPRGSTARPTIWCS